MTAKSSKDRQKAFRLRMREQGLKEIRSLFAHPDDIQRIRAYVAGLTRKRHNTTDKTK